MIFFSTLHFIYHKSKELEVKIECYLNYFQNEEILNKAYLKFEIIFPPFHDKLQEVESALDLAR